MKLKTQHLPAKTSWTTITDHAISPNKNLQSYMLLELQHTVCSVADIALSFNKQQLTLYYNSGTLDSTPPFWISHKFLRGGLGSTPNTASRMPSAECRVPSAECRVPNAERFFYKRPNTILMHLSMLSPSGGTPGICGAFDLFCPPHPREFDLESGFKGGDVCFFARRNTMCSSVPGWVLPQILDRGVPRRFLNPNPI